MIKREGGSLNVFIKERFQLDEIFLVYSTLWVQLVLVVCYTPYLIVRIEGTYSSSSIPHT